MGNFGVNIRVVLSKRRSENLRIYSCKTGLRIRDIKGDADFTQGELEEIKIVGLSNDDLKDEESYGGRVNASQINSLYIKGNIDSNFCKTDFFNLTKNFLTIVVSSFTIKNPDFDVGVFCYAM